MEHFKKLNAIDVNDHVEEKEQAGVKLSYLSWAWAWTEIKKVYPDAQYEIEKFDNLPYVLDPKTGYVVYTKVTIEGITHEMWLPVLDNNNKPMKAEPYDIVNKAGKKTVQAATMFDINKSIMRCLTKNLAMFGLGLYIYAGEDLPESDGDVEIEKPKAKKQKVEPNENTQPKQENVYKCSKCGKDIEVKVYDYSVRKYGEPLCFNCQAANEPNKQKQEKPETLVVNDIKVADTFEQPQAEVNPDDLPWNIEEEPKPVEEPVKTTHEILDELFYAQSVLRQAKINEFILKKWNARAIGELNEEQAQYVINVLQPKETK